MLNKFCLSQVLVLLPSCLEDLFNPCQLGLTELLIPNIDTSQQFSIAIHLPSNRHSFILYLQHFPILNILQFLDVDSMSIQMSDPSFKTKNRLFESDIKVYFQVVSLSFEGRMSYFVQFQVDISWVEIEALLTFSLEEDHIAVLHAFLKIEFKVSWVDNDLVPSANWAFMTRSKPTSSACFALHLDLLHLILHFHFSEHLPTSSATSTGLLLSALVSSSLAVLAYFSPSETVNLIPSCVKLIQWDPHFCPEISSLPQWIFLEFLQTSLAMQIIGDPLGDINQGLVGSFDLHILLLHLLISCIPVRMVLDRQPPERFLKLVTCSLFRDLQKIVEQCLSLRLHDDDNQQKCDYDWPGHNKIQIYHVTTLAPQEYYYQIGQSNESSNGSSLLDALAEALEDCGHLLLFEGDKGEDLGVEVMDRLVGVEFVLLAQDFKVLVLAEMQLHLLRQLVLPQSFESYYLGCNICVVLELRLADFYLVS